MPNELNLAKTFFLISGIFNALCGVGWAVYTLVLGAFSCGIGCVFGFLPVINIIACVMDFVVYSKLTSLNKTGTYSSYQFAAIFDIISFLTGNAISGVFGIVNLVNLNNDGVKNFMVERGIY